MGINLSIIIVNWNTKQLLLDCLASLHTSLRPGTAEIIVVDNGSSDNSVDVVRAAFPAVSLIANRQNRGFAGANNQGLRIMQGKYAVLLNSDTLVTDDALDRMFDFMELHPEAGMCGPQLLNADGSLQNSVGSFPTLATEFLSKAIVRVAFPGTYRRVFGARPAAYTGPARVDYIVGACMMVRKAAMDSAGMLDEDYFFLYEEVDWCFRMQRAGWEVYHLPGARITHLGGQSMKEINLRSRVESWRSRYLFFRKSLELSAAGWYGLLCAGFLQNAYQLLVYSLMNLPTLFLVRRLRRRWTMFGYLLLWHLRGGPASMGIPR